MTDTSRVRSFVAVDLPPDLKEKLSVLQHELKQQLDNARWVNSTNMHLTLKFLGDVPVSKLRRIADTLQDKLAPIHRYVLTPGGLGAFPNTRRPRVLWIGFKDIPEVHFQMVDIIESELVSYGFARERSKHIPHLTLARFRNPNIIKELDIILTPFQNAFLPGINVTSVVIYKSVLTPQGACYTKLHEVLLR